MFRYVASLNYPNACLLFSACDNTEESGETCDYSLLGNFSSIGVNLANHFNPNPHCLWILRTFFVKMKIL
jgi:hypothetical protein